MTAPTDAGTEPRKRLHPLSPLLRGGRLAVLAIVGISWQGYANLGTQRWLAVIAAIAVLTLVGSVVSYLVTGYHVVGRELRIYEGVLSRRVRAIPLERLQAVEMVRPVLARMFNLAELRLEVVGASKTEAPLAFLSVEDAKALRERLLGLARVGQPRPTADTGTDRPDEAAPEAAPERQLHTVNNRDLVVSQLLRPQWWAVPLAIAGPIIYLAYAGDLGLIAVASTITAIIGAVQAPVRAVVNDWRFTLASAHDGLRLHRGLLEIRNQTVPPGRIQAIGVQWPLLWRGHGWVRANMLIAGVAGERGAEQRTMLLPVGTVPVAEQVIGEALPGFRLTDVMVRPVPKRARWLAPLRRRVLGYQLTDTAFVTRDGLVTRRLTVVPYARIQSVRVRQGPLQRLLRVASVYADPAGGGLATMQPVALHVDVAEAATLASALADRSRTARHDDMQGHPTNENGGVGGPY